MAYVSIKARTKSILIYNPNDHNVSVYTRYTQLVYTT